MRREEAERQAAWRNETDERRSRFEFYAFDPSAGLAEEAWEVSMRLRREPLDQGAAVVAALESAGAEGWPDEVDPVAEEPPGRAPGLRADEQDETSLVWRRLARRERRRARPRRPRDAAGRRRDEELGVQADELAVEPRSRLGRAVRLVGGAVIGAALLWVGMTTALVLLVGARSLTGLGIYAGAVLVGVAAVGLGIAIRRS